MRFLFLTFEKLLTSLFFYGIIGSQNCREFVTILTKNKTRESN